MRLENCGAEWSDLGKTKKKPACSFMPLVVRVVYAELLGRWYLRFDILAPGFGGMRDGGLEVWRALLGLSKAIAGVECSWMIGAGAESRLEGQCG